MHGRTFYVIQPGKEEGKISCATKAYGFWEGDMDQYADQIRHQLDLTLLEQDGYLDKSRFHYDLATDYRYGNLEPFEPLMVVPFFGGPMDGDTPEVLVVGDDYHRYAPMIEYAADAVYTNVRIPGGHAYMLSAIRSQLGLMTDA